VTLTTTEYPKLKAAATAVEPQVILLKPD